MNLCLPIDADVISIQLLLLLVMCLYLLFRCCELLCGRTDGLRLLASHRCHDVSLEYRLFDFYFFLMQLDYLDSSWPLLVGFHVVCAGFGFVSNPNLTGVKDCATMVGFGVLP